MMNDVYSKTLSLTKINDLNEQFLTNSTILRMHREIDSCPVKFW